MNAPIQITDPRVTYKRLDLRPRSTVARMRALKAARPVTRGDCIGGIRPCPWASCRHHMVHALKGWRSGPMPKRIADALDVAEMGETCVLDIVDAHHDTDARGDLDGITLSDTAEHMGLTRERARQIEGDAIDALRSLSLDPQDYIDTVPSPAVVTPPLMSAHDREAAERVKRLDIMTAGRAAGASWEAIARRLNAAAVKTRRGVTKWSQYLARREGFLLGMTEPKSEVRGRMVEAAAGVADAHGVLTGPLVSAALERGGGADVRRSSAIRAAQRIASVRGWEKFRVGIPGARFAYAPRELGVLDVIKRIATAKGVNDE